MTNAIAIDPATPTRETTARRFALAAFAIRIVAAGLAFGLQILLARLIGADAYGAIATGLTVILLVTCVATLSLDNASQHFIAAYRATGDFDGLRGYLLVTPAIVGSFALAIGIVGALIASTQSTTLAILLASVPVLALLAMCEGFAKSFDWPILALAPGFVMRPLAIAVMVIAAMAGGWPPDAAGTALAIVASAVVALGLQGALLAGRLRSIVPEGPARRETPRWLSVSTPILIGDFGGLLVVSADVIALSFFTGAAEAGVYFAAIKSLALVQFVAYAVSQASAHQASDLHARGDRASLRAFVRRACLWTFVPSLVFAAMLLAAGPWILLLFGTGFVDGYPAMVIVTVGFVARAAIGPAARVLTMIGAERTSAAIHVTAGLIAVLLSCALVPPLGIIGAAIALSATLTIETAALAVALSRALAEPGLAISPETEIKTAT